MSILVAVVDGDAVIEYDRSRALPPEQLEYLDKMDEKMDISIPDGQGNVLAPDQTQKAQFVASQLMMAIETDNEALISASMAYLANRLENLRQVSSRICGEQKEITLVYDKDYTPAQEVKFVRPEHLNS